MSQLIDTRPHLIYKLIDPRDGETRYVGQTICTLKRRLCQHLYTKEKNHRGCWIRDVLNDGYEPIIEWIETVPADEDWAIREMLWIAIYRGWGCNLVNSTDGGEGLVGYVTKEETKEKLRRANLGYKRTSESIEKSRQGNIGRKHNIGVRANMSKAHLGKKQSPEAIEKTRQGCMKPIAQYAREGKFIKKYESVKTAGEALRISSSSISACARLERPTAGDYMWRLWEETLGADIEPYVGLRCKKRPVSQLTLDRQLIKEYESATEAGRALGIAPSCISKCAKKIKGYRMAGGFIWEYVIE